MYSTETYSPPVGDFFEDDLTCTHIGFQMDVFLAKLWEHNFLLAGGRRKEEKEDKEVRENGTTKLGGVVECDNIHRSVRNRTEHEIRLGINNWFWQSRSAWLFVY